MRNLDDHLNVLSLRLHIFFWWVEDFGFVFGEGDCSLNSWRLVSTASLRHRRVIEQPWPECVLPIRISWSFHGTPRYSGTLGSVSRIGDHRSSFDFISFRTLNVVINAPAPVDSKLMLLQAWEFLNVRIREHACSGLYSLLALALGQPNHYLRHVYALIRA